MLDYKEELLKVGKYNSRFNEILGINPNEEGTSLEIIKRYKDNVMIGIKLNTDGEYLYVSTVHDVQESKIMRRLHSGRIKEFHVDTKETQ